MRYVPHGNMDRVYSIKHHLSFAKALYSWKIDNEKLKSNQNKKNRLPKQPEDNLKYDFLYDKPLRS
jgi:hypothetical protein